MISSVIDRFLESGWRLQPDPTGESSMTTANPLARYSAIWGRARERLRYVELHHHRGRDREPYRGFRSLSDSRRTIRTIDEAVAFAREHREGREAAHREDVIRRLESAKTREQKLDAVNAFRAWLEAENLLFPAF
jgi:hypothetical protein